MIRELLSLLLDKSIFELDSNKIKKIIDFKDAVEIFKADYNRYFSDHEMDKVDIISEPTLVAILCYRIARSFYELDDEKSAKIMSNLGRFYSGFEIYYTSIIGTAFKVNHGLGTVIGARSILGNNVLIHHNVTIGAVDRKTPTIGDSVIIYPGAKILGGINVGENTIIGANSIVTTDVPCNSKVVSPLSRII